MEAIVVYQMPCPGKNGVFVASSIPSPEQALQELQHWAAGNGYRIAAVRRSFTVYSGERQPREWVLLERSQAEESRERA